MPKTEHSYQQLDSLQPLRLQARRELLRESDQHPAVELLPQIPSIGPIRAALLVALLQTPTVSEPSASFGPTVVSPSRPMTVHEIGPACFGTESPISRYAPSDNQK
jgi:hypothetical protein